MITVEKVLEKTNKSGHTVNAANEEQLKTGTVKAYKQSYWPWVLLAGAGIALAVWWYKKTKNNGEVPG